MEGTEQSYNIHCIHSLLAAFINCNHSYVLQDTFTLKSDCEGSQLAGIMPLVCFSNVMVLLHCQHVALCTKRAGHVLNDGCTNYILNSAH